MAHADKPDAALLGNRMQQRRKLSPHDAEHKSNLLRLQNPDQGLRPCECQHRVNPLR